MIKVEGSLRACTCVSTWINWIAFFKKPCFYHQACRGIGFQKHLLFPPACLWLCHVLCTFTLALCMCSHRCQQKYDKVEKWTSPSETIRAPGMESDQKCSKTAISFPHLDIPPCAFHRMLYFDPPPPPIFCFSIFHFHSRCEPHCVHWWLFI